METRECVKKGLLPLLVPLVGRKDVEKLVYEQVRDFTRGTHLLKAASVLYKQLDKVCH